VKSFLPLLLLFAALTRPYQTFAAEVLLSDGGQTSYRIVTSTTPSPEEESAANWLSETLEQVTGARFPILREDAAGLPATQLRVRMDPDLKSEEWRIRTDGHSIDLSGGKPRGTIYAVCEFLETHVGVLRLDPFTEYVPRQEKLKIPDLDRRGRPAFERRVIFTGFPYTHPIPEAYGVHGQRWRVWNKDHTNVGQRVGDYPRLVPEGVHTFGRFLSAGEFAQAHPEYFSMDAGGKRMTDDMGNPALWIQLCVTNPDVQRITLERAKQMLREDVVLAGKEGRDPAGMLVLSQNDNTQDLCLCPECSRVTAREGSQSGPLLEYVNFVARGLQQEFPDVVVLTEAYNFTLKPPKEIHAGSNVMIRYCDNYGLSDMARPLSHPQNAERLKLLTDWSAKADQLAIWDYWRTIEDHSPGFLAPSSNVRAIHADMQLFRKLGVRSVVVESEDFMGAGLNDGFMSYDLQSFMPLRAWLGMKLADDPSRELEPLLDSFCRGYYGPAAQPMRELLELIENRQEQIPLNSADRRRQVWNEALCTPEFFARAYPLLSAAENLVAKTTGRDYVNVRRERIIIDSAFLWSEGRLRRLAPDRAKVFPDRAAVLKRHREDWQAYLESVFDQQGLAIVTPFVEKGLQLAEKLRTEDTDRERTAVAVREGDVILDGKLDEPFWSTATSLRLLPRDPAGANDDLTSVKFAWTDAGLYVGIEQPVEHASSAWEVSLMTPDMQGIQLELFGRPGNVASPYYYRYPREGGMLAVRDRKSTSRVVTTMNEKTTVVEFRIPWSDIDSSPTPAGELLLNIATYPKPDSTTPAYVSSLSLIGSAPAYHPMYYERLTLAP